jgi:TRAP transporter TAXI family solute receptor
LRGESSITGDPDSGVGHPHHGRVRRIDRLYADERDGCHHLHGRHRRHVLPPGLSLRGTAQPITVIRGIACWYPETIQFVVTADSDIMSLADMAGKNVAVGAPGSGTAVACEQILSAAGVWDSIVRFDLNFAESASALRLGEVDVGFLVAGYPTAAIEELAVTEDVRLVDVPDNVLETLFDEGFVFYTRQTVPAGVYRMSQGADTVAVQAMLCVRQDLPDEVAYDMTKILFEEVDQLRTVHTKANDITLETALSGMSVTLHPGAIEYYQEVGLSCPPRLVGQP